MHCVVGLTGGIGCGKTSATTLFAQLGVRVIDADVISHALSKPPSPALEQIATQFGSAFLADNGEMNRDRMRTCVFSDPQARKKLEAIFHPIIRQRILQLISETTAAPYTILVAPLLFENAAFRETTQCNLVIDCSEEQQIERVIARSHLPREAIIEIMAAQLQRDERLKLADYIISNDSTLDKLSEQITRLHQSFLNIAKQMQ